MRMRTTGRRRRPIRLRRRETGTIDVAWLIPRRQGIRFEELCRKVICNRGGTASSRAGSGARGAKRVADRSPPFQLRVGKRRISGQFSPSPGQKAQRPRAEQQESGRLRNRWRGATRVHGDVIEAVRVVRGRISINEVESACRSSGSKCRAEFFPGLYSSGCIAVCGGCQQRTLGAAKQDVYSARGSEDTVRVVNIPNPE